MKQSFIKHALLVVGTFCALTGAQAGEIVKALKVELLVFSGRPNPTFVVTDPVQIKEILALAKNLPKKKGVSASDTDQPEPKLGYQGFIVTNNSDVSSDIKSFAVHGSNVHLALVTGAKEAGKSAVVQAAAVDADSALENKLLAQGQKTGAVDDKLLEFIENSK
ncbi:hypothetical protein [Rugamonas aquatica]|uniref:DUF4410 domain-containing protein n=1 Tax=Rugamonas aquatica TaxID=2743357 RepID=A0A6A7MVC5_9BURK|nr:hypothetical protein [Rugamonas aquatica]MQA37087.1 hypothetical protein [Rugamonas aquatica]